MACLHVSFHDIERGYCSMGDTARQGTPYETPGVVRIVMRDGIEVPAWFEVVLSLA